MLRNCFRPVNMAAALLIVWAATTCAHAQQEAAGETWRRSLKAIPIGPGRLDLGGTLRLRCESFDNFNIRGYSTDEYDDMVLERLRLTADYHLTDDTHLFLMLQDSHFWRSRFEVDDFTGPCPYENALDLRQAYLEWNHIAGSPFGVKVGRQAIHYRDNRVFGPGNWGNVGRYAWDALKLSIDAESARVDAYFAQRVLYDPHGFDSQHHDFDMWAVYAQLKRLPLQLDLFYTLKYDDHGTTTGESGTSDHKRHTMGAYAAHDFGQGWDLCGTVALQRGKYGSDNIDAYGCNVRLGYTFDAAWSPRLEAEFTYASGDSDPADGEHETLDNIFGAVDSMYGRMNLFSWKNLEDYQVNFSVKPADRLKLMLEYHFFRLAAEEDAWYYCNGKSQRLDATGRAGRTLGHEIDLRAKWQVTEYTELLVGYAHFFPGAFMEQTAGGHGSADWAFVQVVFEF